MTMRTSSFVAVLLAAACPAAAPADDEADPAAISQLMARLNDGDVDEQADAAWKIGNHGPAARAAVPFLIEMLADESPYRAKALPIERRLCDDAVDALSEIGSESVDALIAALDHPSTDIRGRAAEALGNIGGKAALAIAPLVRMASEPDEDLQWHARRALVKIDQRGDHVVPLLVTQLEATDKGDRAEAAIALGSYPRQARLIVPALLERLRDVDARVRGQSALALGRLGQSGEQIAPALVGLLADGERYSECVVSACCVFCTAGYVSPDAAWALSRFPDEAAKLGPQIARFVADHLERDDDIACLSLLPILGKDGRQFLPRVVAMLKRPDRPVLSTFRLITMLREIGPYDAGAVPVLRELRDRVDAEDPDAEVQVAAAVALVSIDFEHNPKSWQRLLEELDRDRFTSRDVCRAIRRLGPKAASAVPRLTRLLETRDSNDEVIEALGAIGQAARSAVPAIVGHGDWLFGRHKIAAALVRIGPEVIPDLVADFDRLEEEEQRVGVLEAIGEFGERGAAAVPDLTRLLRSGAPSVRVAAARALGRIHADPRATIPDLRVCLEDESIALREAAARSLGAYRAAASQAVPDLIAALRDEFIDVRVAAAESLSEIGPAARTALPDLKRSLADRSRLVQAAARAAIEELE